jgi:uncharacterized protein YfaP (DUF2135 family)
MTDGTLVISLTWSRTGDGDLIVRTPSGKTISRKNRGPNTNTDQGQLVNDTKTGTGPEDIFWNKNTAPLSGIYSICAEIHSFSPAVNVNNPVTLTVQVRTPPTKSQVFSKTMTQYGGNASCSSTFDTFVTTFRYP